MIQDLDYRLRLSRTRARLQQKDVEERSAINRANVSSYETGANAPTLDNLAKLAVLYKTTADWLLGISREPVMTLEGLKEDQIEAMYAVRMAFLSQNKEELGEQ